MREKRTAIGVPKLAEPAFFSRGHRGVTVIITIGGDAGGGGAFFPLQPLVKDLGGEVVRHHVVLRPVDEEGGAGPIERWVGGWVGGWRKKVGGWVGGWIEDVPWDAATGRRIEACYGDKPGDQALGPTGQVQSHLAPIRMPHHVDFPFVYRQLLLGFDQEIGEVPEVVDCDVFSIAACGSGPETVAWVVCCFDGWVWCGGWVEEKQRA